MNPVKIIADSTCDLSEELVRRYDITIVPLHILLGDEEFEDGVSVTPDQIYAWSDYCRTWYSCCLSEGKGYSASGSCRFP